MHGQHKLSNEGYRTRDGHLIEWFGRKLAGTGSVRVISRPEPQMLRPLRRFDPDTVAANTDPDSVFSWKVPTLRDRQRWWVDSAAAYSRAIPADLAPIVTWNPFLTTTAAWGRVRGSGVPVAFDLLDDWTIHYAFAGIRSEVESAYRAMFEAATIVTANAEGTVELARRFGRDDVVFLPNGCDPERFSTTSTATGPLRVGYVGKIGKRLDLALIIDAARANPDVAFVFAGPVLDAEYRDPMTAEPNIEMLGDVHYDRVPDLMASFDLGWVPHRVGEGEVGGDVIKTYEYRATGLPVLSTPVAGVQSRGLDAVEALEGSGHPDRIRELASRGKRLDRVVTPLPPDVQWSGKADVILSGIGVNV